MKNNMQKDKVRNGILGFIVGDAMGVPLEFTKRREENQKVVDMIGFGSHRLEKGSWSDDSSKVIATMQSMIDHQGQIIYKDMMDNFIKWIETGEFTSNHKTFGIGRTTLKALMNYHNRKIEPIKCGIDSFKDNGNGSLMRILPIAYYCFCNNLNNSEILEVVKNISSLTHSHQISILGCYIYTLLCIELLRGSDKEASYKYLQSYDFSMFDDAMINYYHRILKADITLLAVDDISSSGFVVDTLEALLWCFLNTDTYDDSIIKAINLGGDTDTIAALVGGLSGIYHGNINIHWIKDIKRIEYIEGLINDFYDCFN